MIHETKQHHELLKNAEAKKELPRNGDDYFLLLNTRLKIVTCNQSASRLLNQLNAASDLQSFKAMSDLVENPKFHWLKEMLQNAQKGQTSRHEVLINAESDNSYWVRFTVSPAYNNKKEIAGISCVGCNLHKEKTQEEKIKIQKSVLRQIAQIYSHKVRHPLTNILAIIDLIKCEDFKMTKMYLGFLESASKELDHVIRSVVLDSVQAA